MAVYVPDGLPAVEKLKEENADIRVYSDGIPESSQKILILNLMPTKQATETQLIRMLLTAKNSVSVFLMNTVTYTSKNTASEYLERFYRPFNDYKDCCFDGLIVTGAPVEHLDFGQVLYWNELCGIFVWAETHVKKIYTVCWGAQAALNCYFGINKHPLPEKMFGVFSHKLIQPENPLCLGVEDGFSAPHSRHSDIYTEDIEKCGDLDLLAVSPEAGFLWAATKDKKITFMTGHPEYDAETLSLEYFRDLEKGDKINCPKHYFPNDNPASPPPLTWRENAKIIYSNWINLEL
ncbi:MAG: homoserine O-succinyltransferase [Clostridia bacterium]|nr:homoserine O-succinyltransferase [Clostridia bacterium]